MIRSIRTTKIYFLVEWKAQYNNFYHISFAYTRNSVSYIIEKFPLTDTLIYNDVRIDIRKRQHATYDNVHYFLERFLARLLKYITDHDVLLRNFMVLSFAESKWNGRCYEEEKVVSRKVNGEDVIRYRVDVLLWHSANMVFPETAMKQFRHQFKQSRMYINWHINSQKHYRGLSALL